MTALAATFQAGTGATPARVLLQVTAAPAPPAAAYVNNFATTDGWTGSGGTVFVAGSPNRLQLASIDADPATYSRTVTGLTIGANYRYQATIQGSHGNFAIGVSGKGATAYVHPPDFVDTVLTFDFAATATSHVIQVLVIQTPGSGSFGLVFLMAARVDPTDAWQGTTIRRTDANGTDVTVREAPGGQDTSGASGSATMTVTDYEAALTGTVSYTVTDGNGGTANAQATPPGTAGVWLTLPATSNPGTPTAPRFVPVELVLAFTESSDSNGSLHKIVGRADPIANPGPLASREGTLGLWCSDYATAAAARELLAAGDVAQLRQPSFPGMDLYLYATRVGLVPEEPTVPTQRWVVTLEYQEVTTP